MSQAIFALSQCAFSFPVDRISAAIFTLISKKPKHLYMPSFKNFRVVTQVGQLIKL